MYLLSFESENMNSQRLSFNRWDIHSSSMLQSFVTDKNERFKALDLLELRV